MNRSLGRSIKWFVIVAALCLAIYGAGRLYYKVTDGFTIGNIVSTLSYQEKWAITPLSNSEKKQVSEILSQPYRYVGKGCQSYVFLSQDGDYVLKFVKYQRFRPQAWLDYFQWVPGINPIRLYKIQKKEKKLDMLFDSWKIAYENLKEETGLVYVHLNKTKDFHQPVVIFDKLGFQHEVDIDDMEFLIQKKAQMLCPALEEMMAAHQEKEAVRLIDQLLAMILFEYARGFADNDHALMQNTGVLDGRPIHIDAGQFVKNEEVKKSEVFKQELFSKTFKFHKWLQKRYPSLAEHLQSRLVEIIGSEFYSLKPQVKNHAWSE